MGRRRRGGGEEAVWRWLEPGCLLITPDRELDGGEDLAARDRDDTGWVGGGKL